MPSNRPRRERSAALRPVEGRQVLSRYAHLPWGARCFLALRWIWTPYREMASLFPAEGGILDGGCGHGLLALTLALQDPRRKVLGLDHSSTRIQAAQKAARGLGNLAFQKGDYSKLPPGAFQGIALIDVLHYLPHETQAAFLRKAVQRLKSGGILVFREVDRRPGFASLFNRIHEALMTGLGWTKAAGLYFRNDEGWKQAAFQAGITVQSKPTGRFPFADILYWGTKP